jgi:hypothetical protein
MDKIKGDLLLDLDHGLTTADKLPGAALKDLDLVPAYLTKIYLVDRSHSNPVDD